METKTATEIGAMVRARRKTLGFTQQDLAVRAGVSRKWVVELEAGKATVQFGSVLDVLEALSIDAGELNGSAARPLTGRAHDDEVASTDRIRARAEQVQFGSDLLASGGAVVGLDEHGEVIRYEPDGTTSLVA